MLFKTRRRVTIILASIFIILLYVSKNWFIVIPFVITIVAMLLFSYIDKSYKFNFPDRYYVFIFFIFIFGTIIGGGYPPFGLYYRVIVFDKILHFVSPMMLCAITFYVVNRLGIALKWKLLMTVWMVFGVLGLFEIGEYLSDLFFGTLHQGVYLFDLANWVHYETVSGPNDDTMQDLILGFLSSITFATYKVFESKVRKK